MIHAGLFSVKEKSGGRRFGFVKGFEMGGLQKKERYTIDDIARELGVSKTTVSRAISGKGRIGEATRKRVLDFIEEHDFQPNIVAKNLAQSRTGIIGLAIPGDYSLTEAAFYQECVAGICEEASKYGYEILLALMENGEMTQLERILRYKKADGIIVTRGDIDTGIIRMLKQAGIPFAVTGSVPDPDVICMDNDNEGASRELTKQLLLEGKRLVLLGGDENHYVTHSRKKGFVDAFESRQMKPDEGQLIMNVLDYATAEEVVMKALENGAEILVCMDDYICSLALRVLRNHRIAVPEQVGVASLYDSPFLAQYMPPVTGISFDVRSLACQVCRKLVGILEEQDYTLDEHIGYEIHFRESTQYK